MLHPSYAELINALNSDVVEGVEAFRKHRKTLKIKEMYINMKLGIVG